jgi:hypothetical protein
MDFIRLYWIGLHCRGQISNQSRIVYNPIQYNPIQSNSMTVFHLSSEVLENLKIKYSQSKRKRTDTPISLIRYDSNNQNKTLKHKTDVRQLCHLRNQLHAKNAASYCTFSCSEYCKYSIWYGIFEGVPCVNYFSEYE